MIVYAYVFVVPLSRNSSELLVTGMMPRNYCYARTESTLFWQICKIIGKNYMSN